MKAMERRGHQVVWPRNGRIVDVNLLLRCDVVHVYRQATEQVQQLMALLKRHGIATTYDNDDNLASAPKDSPDYKLLGGRAGERQHAMTVGAARLATTFTTTTDALAELYRDSGVQHVVVIDNYLRADLARPQVPHEGVVVGWFAHPGHIVDANRIGIPDALRSLINRHEGLRVDCIGVDLGLPERYTHELHLPFEALIRRIGSWDIGIAPLADLQMNAGRSSIKVKEYAGSGLPWLASPVGGYAGLGEDQGGHLVPNDGWFDALDRLVTNTRERRQLGRMAKKWAKSQTINAGADRWEQVFMQAVAR